MRSLPAPRKSTRRPPAPAPTDRCNRRHRRPAPSRQPQQDLRHPDLVIAGAGFDVQTAQEVRHRQADEILAVAGQDRRRAMLDGLGQQHAVVAVARVYPQHALADGPRQRDLVGIPAGDDGRIAAHRNRLQRDDIAAVAGVDRQAAGQAAVDQRDLIRVLAGRDARIAAHRHRLQLDDVAAVAGVDRQAAGQAAVDQRDLIRVLAGRDACSAAHRHRLQLDDVAAVAGVDRQAAGQAAVDQRDLIYVLAARDARITAHRHRLQLDDVAAVAGVDRQAAGQAAVDQRDLIRVLAGRDACSAAHRRGIQPDDVAAIAGVDRQAAGQAAVDQRDLVRVLAARDGRVAADRRRVQRDDIAAVAGQDGQSAADARADHGYRVVARARLDAHAARGFGRLQHHAVITVLRGHRQQLLRDQARADLDIVLAGPAQDLHRVALGQQAVAVQRAASVGGRAEADGVGAGLAAVDDDFRRQQAAVYSDGRGLAVGAAVIAVHAQVHALSGRDQAAGLTIGRSGDIQVVAGQQARHAHGAERRAGRHMNVPAHASRAGTRRQPDVARLDPAHVERQRLRGALRIVSLGHLHQHDVAAGRGIERGLRPDGRHDQRVVDRRAGGVGLAVAADRAGRREIQAAADDDRIGAAGGQARMRRLVVDDTGLAAQADLVAVARFHVRQRQVMRAQLADRHGPWASAIR